MTLVSLPSQRTDPQALAQLDNNVARDLAQGLRDPGHDIATAAELGLVSASDPVHLWFEAAL